MLTLRDAINDNYYFKQRSEYLYLTSFSGTSGGEYLLLSDDMIIQGKFLSHIRESCPYEPSLTMWVIEEIG